MKLRLAGSRRLARQVGDLPVRVALYVVQDENGAGSRRKLRNGPLQVQTHRRLALHPLRIGPLRRLDPAHPEDLAGRVDPVDPPPQRPPLRQLDLVHLEDLGDPTDPVDPPPQLPRPCRLVPAHLEDLAGRVDPVATTDAFLARLGPLGDALVLALVALEWAPWPLVPKLRPFSALDASDQQAVLADLRDSRLGFKRQLFAAAKSVGCLAYYGSPQSHAALGYPGPFGDNEAAMEWSDLG